MDKILYFPTINIVKSNWLMGSLFYWDKIGSIVPIEFLERPELLDDHMRMLVEVQLIEQVVPENYIWEINNFEKSFMDFIDKNEIISKKVRMLRRGTVLNGKDEVYPSFNIHMGKLDSIGQELVQRGLAIKQRSWYKVEGYTASNFMTYLATVLGTLTDYMPITDSYHQMYHFLPLEEGDLPHVLKEQLKSKIINNVLPIPKFIEDPYDIYRFKEKYYDSLKGFRRFVESFIQDLEHLSENQQGKRLELFTEQAKDEISYITDRMKDYRWRMLDFASICSLGSSALTLGKGIIEQDVVDVASSSFGLMGAFCAALGKEKLIELERKPLAYAAILNKQFNVSKR
ncbi:hypothetical protein [Fictibacillus fluitans]|uniref:Uncharacterized protein n=1 Tax=Fictibacillus fluitans TaxID=3058422 RepID=A0ABT8HUJ1_9BACL|nr:hypothetical protein [Fictibacillus sp. NE201]MDN4524408.1 hypothetical protein [Fictibacillus sp. NE201]